MITLSAVRDLAGPKSYKPADLKNEFKQVRKTSSNQHPTNELLDTTDSVAWLHHFGTS